MKQGRHIQFSYIVIGVLAFCYVLIRAIKVGVTYDEAWTISQFVPQSVLHILNYSPCDANNHLTNTLLIKLFFSFGNESLLIARLPNVLAFLLYLYYGYKLTSKHLSPFVGLSCFLLLLLNPFLLDFFSLARGYGLSLGFILASIYFACNYVREGSISSVVKSVGLGAIAVLCNFSVLNYWMALVVVVNGIALLPATRHNFKKTFLYSLGIALLLTAISYEPIRKLKLNGNLSYGGSISFYSDTLTSLTKYTLYNSEYASIVNYSLVGFLVVLGLFVVISFFFDRTIYSLKNVILGITTLSILSVILQHYLLGTLYVTDRTALFFYPLLIFCLCFSANTFSNKHVAKSIVVVVLLMGINLGGKANLYKTATWYFDAHSEEILGMINEKGKAQNKKMKIDFSWPFESSFYYHQQHTNYPFVEVVKIKEDREALNTEADVYIYLDQSLDKVGYDVSAQKIRSVDKDTIKQYASEHVFVFGNLKEQ